MIYKVIERPRARPPGTARPLPGRMIVDPYANCDGSTIQPVLNVADFICFQTSYAAGCS